MQPQNPHNAALILIVLATATCHGAGWSGVWPAQEHPRETVRQLAECYTAVVERCTLWPVDAPDAPVWYRSNRATLIELKSHLRLAATVTPFVNTNICGTEALAGQWLTAHLGSDFPFYGKTGDPTFLRTNLLTTLKMPTNYFDYVPYRCLNGLGPFTNDTSVPYPHGYTNAQTAGGGTNYPAGRACWYTTDYGWNQLPALINALTTTRHAISLYDTNRYSGSGASPIGYETEASWDLAVYRSQTNWHTIPAFGLIVGYGHWGSIILDRFGESTGWSSFMQGSQHYYIPVNNVTNFASYGYYYVYPSKVATDGFYTQSTFEAHGDLLVETNYCLAATDPSNVWGSVMSTIFGTTNVPATTAKPGPGVAGQDRGTIRGWTPWTQTPRSYRRWDVPGGFTFH
jgi:hypothetical protein